jgi:hypothetical protein
MRDYRTSKTVGKAVVVGLERKTHISEILTLMSIKITVF